MFDFLAPGAALHHLTALQFLRKKHAQNFGDAGFLTCTNLAAL